MNINSLVTPPNYTLDWQMSAHERIALSGVLSKIKPMIAIEVGTYKGGSLQALSEYSQKVISIDIDPSVKVSLKPKFDNVDFFTGNSSDILKHLLSIEEVSNHLSFILVDGDHSAQGIINDLVAIFNNFIPKQTCVLFLHDSFNPECRRGILAAPWSQCAAVHELDVDFIPGKYYKYAYDTAAPRTMWGGFACAILEPYQRNHDLVINQTHKDLFDIAYKSSSHSFRPHNFAQILKDLLKKLIKKK